MTDRASEWVRRTEWPLAAAAAVFLIAYAVPIAAPDISADGRRLCAVLLNLVWVLFIADYLVRLYLAPERWPFFYRHLFDFCIIVLPILRPLRLLRLLALLVVFNRAGSRSLRGKVVVYASGGALTLLVIGALAITDAERGHPDAAIQSIGDGAWWAITTMTTVGYGDAFPVTTTGRFVAATLMIGGIALLGVVTATIASWLVEQVGENTEESENETKVVLHELTSEVRALRSEIEALRGASAHDLARGSILAAPTTSEGEQPHGV